MKHKLFLIIIILCLVLVPSAVRAGTPPLKALIVTGRSNHNWQISSPILKKLLADTGLFTVDIAASPPKGGDMRAFNPDFAAYNVVVLDYNGDSWNPRTKEAFVHYVKNGGGVVAYHAANNAFPGWPEFNEITGLGGWEGRDEKAGPYLYWQDGKVVRDTTPGIGGYHGIQHDFLVLTRDPDHPVTRGLPGKWMHAQDELYSLLRGPAKNIRVLATAYSALEAMGTGRHEPVLFTISYGKGRIFHTVLGHAMSEDPPPAMACAGFIVTFQRGAEWAATGKVTQEIPGDFPATTKDKSAPEDVRRRKGFRPPSLDHILAGVSSYKFGLDRTHLSGLQDYIQANLDSAAALRRCETKLITFLDSAAPLDAKQFVCRQLRVIGTEASIPVLIKMVQKEETADMARYALQEIPGKAVDRALLDILPGTRGKIKIGIIDTLGRRGDAGSAADLAGLTTAPDDAIAAAAITALGNIAGSKASAALTAALKGSKQKHRLPIEDALLKCAGDFAARDNLKEAGKIYKKLVKSGSSPAVGTAALRGRIACSGNKSGKIISDVLKSKQTGLHSAAVSRVSSIEDNSIINASCERLPHLETPIQVQLIAALSGRNSPDILPALVKAANSKEEEVRAAALEALGQQGDASTVYLLARRAAAAKGAEQKAARTSLYGLSAAGVDRAIIRNLIAVTDPGIRIELFQAVAERRIEEGKGVVLSMAKYGVPECRRAALKALKVIARPEDLPELIAVLKKAKTGTVRKEAESAIAAAVEKSAVAADRAEAVLRAYRQEQNSEIRCSLLRVLGKIGCNTTLPALRSALAEKNEKIRDTAIRVLSGWPHPAAQDDLFAVAKSTGNMVHHVLTLQGYIRLLRADKYRSPASMARRFKEALHSARRVEEQREVLAALPDFASQDALAVAESCLKKNELAAEAKQAVEKIKTLLEPTRVAGD